MADSSPPQPERKDQPKNKSETRFRSFRFRRDFAEWISNLKGFELPPEVYSELEVAFQQLPAERQEQILSLGPLAQMVGETVQPNPRADIFLRLEEAVSNGDLDPDVLAVSTRDLDKVLAKVPEDVAAPYQIPKQVPQTRRRHTSLPKELSPEDQRFFSLLDLVMTESIGRPAASRAFPILLDSLRDRWEAGDQSAFKEAILLARNEVDQAVESLLENLRWIVKELVRIGRNQVRTTGQGRQPKLTPQEELQVYSEFKIWFSRCQAVNERLGATYDNPAWLRLSREERQEMMERIAKAINLSVEQVRMAWRYILTTSRKRGKATPWEAACELIADLYGIGAGTVEKILSKFDPQK
jgi:hypothetical protein